MNERFSLIHTSDTIQVSMQKNKTHLHLQFEKFVENSKTCVTTPGCSSTSPVPTRWWGQFPPPEPGTALTSLTVMLNSPPLRMKPSLPLEEHPLHREHRHLLPGCGSGPRSCLIPYPAQVMTASFSCANVPLKQVCVYCNSPKQEGETVSELLPCD